MPDDITPAAAPIVAPAVPAATPPAATAAVPVAAAAPVATPPAPASAPATAARPIKTLADLLGEKTPDAATKRLVREARKALEKFGIEIGKDDDIEVKAAEHKAKQDARKTERQELKAKAEKAERYESLVTAHVAAQMADLTEEQRQVVKATAGADPAAQLAQLTTLRAIGFIKPKEAVAAVAPTVAPAAPIAAPASSAPAQPGPVATSVNPTDLKATYLALKNSKSGADRIMAGQIAMRNPHLFLPSNE